MNRRERLRSTKGKKKKREQERETKAYEEDKKRGIFKERDYKTQITEKKCHERREGLRDEEKVRARKVKRKTIT